MSKKLPPRTQVVNGRVVGSRGRIPRPFEDWIDVETNSKGCWLWNGPLVTNGYGKAWLFNRSWRAHRAAWTIYRGEIPEGMQVLHRCDVPRCVNPDHLYLGNQSVNITDCVLKGRHHKTRLKPGEVRLIRECLVIGYSQSELARQFGVSPASIQSIAAGRTWSKVV